VRGVPPNRECCDRFSEPVRCQHIPDGGGHASRCRFTAPRPGSACGARLAPERRSAGVREGRGGDFDPLDGVTTRILAPRAHRARYHATLARCASGRGCAVPASDETRTPYRVSPSNEGEGQGWRLQMPRRLGTRSGESPCSNSAESSRDRCQAAVCPLDDLAAELAQNPRHDEGNRQPARGSMILGIPGFRRSHSCTQAGRPTLVLGDRAGWKTIEMQIAARRRG